MARSKTSVLDHATSIAQHKIDNAIGELEKQFKLSNEVNHMLIMQSVLKNAYAEGLSAGYDIGFETAKKPRTRRVMKTKRG